MDAIFMGACSEVRLNLRTGALATDREAEEASRLAVQVLSLALLLLMVLIGGMEFSITAGLKNER